VTNLEREIKLEFDSRLPIAEIVGIADSIGVSAVQLPERILGAEYFDTQDLRLTRWGCSLRHRSDEGWMVKLPSPSEDAPSEVLSRSEVQFSSEGVRPPDGAIALVASFTRGEQLQPVAHLRTCRTPWRLEDAQGEAIGELVGDDVEVCVPGEASWSFWMVEIELSEGATTADVASFVERFEQVGARLTPRSKIARALGKAASAPPEVVVPRVSSSPTAREVIHAAIARSVRSYLLQVPYARLGDDPEGLHQARVALRRLRADLRTFAPLLDQNWVSELVLEARWLSDHLGVVRDADVRLAEVSQLMNEEPSISQIEAARMRRVLEDQRDTSRASLLDALGDPRCNSLYGLLVDAGSDPRTVPQADDPATESVPALLRRPWRKLNRAVGIIDSDSTYDDYHRVRIKAKQWRYAAEAVEPVIGKPARRMATAAKRIQKSLGDLNDAVVIRAHLAETATRHSDLAFACGEISGLLAARAKHCIADFERAWAKAEGVMPTARKSK
jgi:CHAD domain-containing protein